MNEVREQDLFSRQSTLLDDGTRKGMAGVIVGGVSAPWACRALLWGLGTTGIGSIACDFQGDTIGAHTLQRVHPEMMTDLAPFTYYQCIDPGKEFLPEDVESFAIERQPQQATIFVFLNSPREALDSLMSLPDTLGPVVLLLSSPTTVFAESCRDVAHAASRIRSVRDLPDIPEGPTDMAMLAAGNATYEMTMTQRNGGAEAGHGVFAFYCENQEDPVRWAGNDLRAAFELCAAPARYPVARFSGKRLAILGASGTGGPLHVATSTDGSTQIGTIERDVLETSNLNRALLYRHADVGLPKATACPERCDELDPEGVHWGDWNNVQTESDLAKYETVKAFVAAVDGDDARSVTSRAFRSMGIAYATGATGPRGAYVMFQPPGAPCFDCQTGADPNSTRMASGPSCLRVAEPSICATNMICAALISRGLRMMLADSRRPVNLRFRGERNRGNRLVRKATPSVACSHG